MQNCFICILTYQRNKKSDLNFVQSPMQRWLYHIMHFVRKNILASDLCSISMIIYRAFCVSSDGSWATRYSTWIRLTCLTYYQFIFQCFTIRSELYFRKEIFQTLIRFSIMNAAKFVEFPSMVFFFETGWK